MKLGCSVQVAPVSPVWFWRFWLEDSVNESSTMTAMVVLLARSLRAAGYSDTSKASSWNAGVSSWPTVRITSRYPSVPWMNAVSIPNFSSA